MVHAALDERMTPGNGGISVVLGQFGTVIGCGLRQVLSEDRGLRVVGEGLDHTTLEVAVAELAPRVAVLGEASVTEGSVLKRLLAVQPDIGLVMLVYWPTRAYGARLLGSGVAACLSIDASAPELLGAIRLAADGKQVLASVPDGSIQATHYAAMASLTPREREVLRLLSLGKSNAQIALKLRISIETARTHVRHILGKLGAGRRQELLGVATPERLE